MLLFVALFRIAACLRRYRARRKKTHNPNENCCSLCWRFHFSFGFSEESFEPAFTLVKHRCSQSFAEMKNTFKVCLCRAFMTTVSEPAPFKTPLHATRQEAERTRWSLPWARECARCRVLVTVGVHGNSSVLSRRPLLNGAGEGLLKWMKLKGRGACLRLFVSASCSCGLLDCTLPALT